MEALIENLEITNKNGVIRGKISKPYNNPPKGALICLHGGPGGNFHGNNDIFDQISSKMLQSDYLTVQFSMFGAEPSDGQQKDTSIKSQLIDYQSVIDFTESHYNCPIHVIGESAGATIVSLNWLKNIKSYILLWPAFDLKNTDLGPYLTKEWWSVVDKNGFLNDNGVIIGKELFIELLLTDFTKSFLLPQNDILMIHGQSDNEVPYSQSINAILNANGLLKFIGIPNADHGCKSTENRKIVNDEIYNWLIKY